MGLQLSKVGGEASTILCRSMFLRVYHAHQITAAAAVVMESAWSAFLVDIICRYGFCGTLGQQGFGDPWMP